MHRWLLALLAASLVLASCSKNDRLPVFPVRGQVFDSSQDPAAGALVVFHPVDPTDGPLLKPLAYVDRQGAFRLTTYEQGDGAPAGKYVVTIEWRQRSPNPFGPNKEGKDRLRGKYSDPQSSDFRFTVQKQTENVVPPIHLKRPE